jgi:predicted  nucleic acid-binding Zn-ribbon protein
MTHPFDSLALLAGLDAEITTLERSRAQLPARRALGELEARLSELDRALALLAAERLPLDATLESLESEAARLGERERELSVKLEHATGAGRELAVMDAEVHRIAELRDELETRELELLEALEPLEARQRQLADERSSHLTGRDELIAKVERADQQLDGELADRRRRRSEVASDLDPTIQSRYEQIAARSDGVGAARLEHGHCGGCHLSLASVELDRLKRMPIDELALCEQCSRILLRPEQLG